MRFDREFSLIFGSVAKPSLKIKTIIQIINFAKTETI